MIRDDLCLRSQFNLAVVWDFPSEVGGGSQWPEAARPPSSSRLEPDKMPHFSIDIILSIGIVVHEKLLCVSVEDYPIGKDPQKQFISAIKVIQ